MVSSFFGMCVSGIVMSTLDVWADQPTTEVISSLQTALKTPNKDSLSSNMLQETSFPESAYDVMSSEQSQKVSTNRLAQQAMRLTQGDNKGPRGSRCTVQLGYPRTASTLQFTAECIIKLLLHPGQDVKCGFGTDAATLRTCKNGEGLVLSKEHGYDHLDERLHEAFGDERPDNFEVVMSVSEDTEGWTDKAKGVVNKWHMPLKYTQTIPMLEEKGMYIFNDYQPIYQLTNAEMDQLRNILRYWTVLRQCCGWQMSHDWLNELQDRDEEEHWDKGSGAYPACQIYNMDEIQSLLLEQPLWWDLVYATDVSERKAAYFTEIRSGQDYYLNCSRANSYLRSHHDTETGGTPPETYDAMIN